MDKGKKFSLDEQFQKYLDLVKLDKRKMPPYQLREIRRAFYGACGQMLVLLRDEVGAQDEEKGAESLQDMLNQVGEFWLKENNRSN